MRRYIIWGLKQNYLLSLKILILIRMHWIICCLKQKRHNINLLSYPDTLVSLLLTTHTSILGGSCLKHKQHNTRLLSYTDLTINTFIFPMQTFTYISKIYTCTIYQNSGHLLSGFIWLLTGQWNVSANCLVLDIIPLILEI